MLGLLSFVEVNVTSFDVTCLLGFYHEEWMYPDHRTTRDACIECDQEIKYSLKT